MAQDGTFEGKDGDELEKFILSVRKYAFAQNKSKDDEWIADFVRPCLTGAALRWYMNLDEEVRSSWWLLGRALLDQYPPVE